MATKRLHPTEYTGHGLPSYPAFVNTGCTACSDKKCWTTVYTLSYVFSVRWALVKAVMNFPVPYNVGNFLTSWKPISFSTTLLYLRKIHARSGMVYRQNVFPSHLGEFRDMGAFGTLPSIGLRLDLLPQCDASGCTCHNTQTETETIFEYPCKCAYNAT